MPIRESCLTLSFSSNIDSLPFVSATLPLNFSVSEILVVQKLQSIEVIGFSLSHLLDNLFLYHVPFMLLVLNQMSL